MCSAAHNAQQNARFNKSAQQKRPCRPKTVKRFFGGFGSHGLSGQAKERMRILPVRRGVLRPARRAMCRAGRFCAACRCYAGFCARCPGAFSLLQPRRLCVRLPAGAPAFRGFVSRPAGSLPLLRLACAAGACLPFACHALVCAGLLLPLFGLFGSPRRGAGRCRRSVAVRVLCRRWARVLRLCFRPSCSAAFVQTFAPVACLSAVRFVYARIFLLSFAFSASLLPLKILFTCRSCRDGHPIFFSERKWGKRTARGVAPSNPIPAPCGQSPLSPRCWPAYAAFRPQTAG